MTNSRVFRPSRRTLLGLTAAAAGALTLPRSVSASAPAAAAPTILTDDIFPIGLYWPPPRSHTTQPRYDEIAACGINVVLGGNDVVDMPANQAMLNAAAGAGLRALPIDNRVSEATPCPDWETALRAVISEYQAYPAFAGFLIADEPSPVHYPRQRMIADVIGAASPESLSHINLVPIYDPALEGTYREHLARYVAQVAPSFVSFDHYPLFTDGGLRATYFLNHALVRQRGLASGLPTWVYVQAVDHWNLKRPNKAELAFQLSISLAYGIKGVKYFTYWTPVERPDFEFGAALIGKDGLQTQVYRDAKELNLGYLQPVGRQLKHKISESVVHANETPPIGARPFAPSAQLRAVSGSPVVLGQFKASGVDDGQRWLLVANRSYTARASAQVVIQPEVGSVTMFVPSTGTYERIVLIDTPNGRAFDVGLSAGMGTLYRLSPAAVS